MSVTANTYSSDNSYCPNCKKGYSKFHYDKCKRCKDCCDEDYRQNIYDVRELLILSKNKIQQLSRRDISELKAGRDCGMKRQKIAERLHTYNSILEKHIAQLARNDKLCLCPKDLQLLTESVTDIIGKGCRAIYQDVEIDNTGEEIWAFKHPMCRSYKEWEKWSKYFCGKLEIDISATDLPTTELMFEISRQTVSSNVLLALNAYHEANDLDLKVSRTEVESKLDFQILYEKLPDIDLDLETYMTLVDNNLSFDIIETIYESGLSLSLNKDEQSGEIEITLVGKLSEYPIDKLKMDLKFLGTVDIAPEISKLKLLSDYKK